MYAEAVNAKSSKSGWLGGIMSVLASMLALLCPVCIASSLGLVASLGSGLAASEQFIRPLLIALLVVAVATFAWSAGLHRHWWVVPPGIGGGVLVCLGRYYVGFSALWMNQVALWAGTSVLIGASLVNFWLKRSCPSCAKEPVKSDAGNGSCCNIQQTKREKR